MPAYPEVRSSVLPPKEPSVFDSYTDRVLRGLAGLVGADDPAGTMMGVAGPLTAGQAQLNPAIRAGVEKVKASPVGQAVGKTMGAYRDRVIRAFHGSPHDFDKFSMEKIGTGEGAQAYGHGLYFAEDPGVAATYRKTLGADAGVQVFEGLSDAEQAQLPKAVKATIAAIGDGHDIPDSFLQHQITSSVSDPAQRAQVSAIVEKARAAGFKSQHGRGYEVNIHADPDRFLDWDVPVGKQSPQVQKAASGLKPVEVRDGVQLAGGGTLRVVNDPDFGPRYFMELGGKRFRLAPQDLPNLLSQGTEGRALYQRLSTDLGSDAAASQRLKELGVPGLKYLDQGSRSAGEGTRNYVVFDDKLVSIVKKYVAAGMTFGEAMRRAQAEQGGTQ